MSVKQENLVKNQQRQFLSSASGAAPSDPQVQQTLFRIQSQLQPTDQSKGSVVLQSVIEHPEVEFINNTLGNIQHTMSGDIMEDTLMEQQRLHNTCELTLAYSSPWLLCNIPLQRFCIHERYYEFSDQKGENSRELRAWRNVPLADHAKEGGVREKNDDFRVLQKSLHVLQEKMDNVYKMLGNTDGDEEIEDILPPLHEVTSKLQKQRKVQEIVYNTGISTVKWEDIDLPNNLDTCFPKPEPISSGNVLPFVEDANAHRIVDTTDNIDVQWRLEFLGKAQDSSSISSRSTTQSKVSEGFENFLRFLGLSCSSENVLAGFVFQVSGNMEVKIYRKYTLTKPGDAATASAIPGVKWLVKVNAVGFESEVVATEDQVRKIVDIIQNTDFV